MRRSLLILLLGVLTSCTHELDTSAPAVSSIMPNLACDQQITKAITVTGIDFTPLPTKALGTEVLNLPTVTLTATANLDGTAASGAMPVTVPGSGDDPMGVHVRWEAETQMSFDVFPDLNLSPGLYDVSITNPDGKAGSLPQALAIVPPPMIGSVMPANVCDAQAAQMITVAGSGFLSVDSTTPTVTILDMSGNAVFTTSMTTVGNCMPVGMRTPALQECSTLAFTVPEGAVPPGMYTLRVTNPADAECSSTESIPFVVEPPPTIASVLPTHICQGGGMLSVKGSGFLPGASVSLSEAGMMPTNATNVSVPDGMTANASFGAVNGNVGDKLDVTLKNADGCQATLPAAVTVVPGPIVFYVDPPFVYGNIITPVTIYTTGVAAPLPSTNAVVLTPSGGGAPIDVTADAKIDPNHPKHIILDVPAGLAAGAYDVTITDATGCPAFYAKAITVVNQTTPLKDIVPPFGYDSANTAVQIDASAAFFQGGVRAYLSPHGAATTLALPLSSVVFQSATTITAVVPGSPTNKLTDGAYDVITVNPDGTIGLLPSGFTVLANPPPVITSSAPGSLPTNCGTACNVTLTGSSFAAGATVTATCTAPGGTPTSTMVTTGTVTATTAAVNFPTIPMTAGTVCSFRITQTVGGAQSFADGGVVVVTNPASKLTPTTSGSNLNTARRAPALTFNGPTSATRNLYVIGGDNAAATPAPIDTVEVALADGIHGSMGAWTTLPGAGVFAAGQGNLPTALTYSQAASIGRFIYNVGGFDGTSSVKTVTRAEVLDPAESPQLNDADLTPDPSVGLQPGLYYYRVAAVLGSADPNNPSGETLAGDEFAVNVPNFNGKKFQVTIAWAGAPATVAKWRIYRTSMPNAMPGSEDSVFETANASSTTFLDTNAGYMGGKPLPFGALGNWKAVASLNTARAGAGVTVAPDPAASGVFYLYAAYGYDSTGATAALQFPATYEVLKVTVSGTTLTEGVWTPQTIVGATGRWQLGAFAATPDVDPAVGANEYVYFGTGVASTTGNMPTSNVEYGSVTTATGVLATATSQAVTGKVAFGYGAVTAVNTVFELGGQVSGGFTDKMNGGTIGTAGALGTFGPQGTGIIQTTGGTSTPLLLPGAVVGQAYFWIVGGATGSLNAETASNQTFFVLY